MYGPCNFADPFWNMQLPHVKSKLPPSLSEDFLSQVYREDPVPTRGGVSLEGQGNGLPDFNNPRVAFAFNQISTGRVMDAIFPARDWAAVDPLLNISAEFPPTFIAHGKEDNMVRLELSRTLAKVLTKHGVLHELLEIPGEGHTFAGSMEVGSDTWELQKRGFDFLENLIG
jgi:acetyl esterase/lipase